MNGLRGKVLVKVDVEGGEYEVLLGAQQLLARKPIWVVEITSGEFSPQGVKPTREMTFSEFLARGYKMSRINDHNWVFA